MGRSWVDPKAARKFARLGVMKAVQMVPQWVGTLVGSMFEQSVDLKVQHLVDQITWLSGGLSRRLFRRVRKSAVLKVG